MKELKGKCKTCLGCNKLSERGFRGVKKCKYYERDCDLIDKNFLIFAIFELFVVFAVCFTIYKILILNIGG